MIDSLPVSNVENSQPEGIGRVATLAGGCAWNNLGRNVVFADRSLRPLAVFGDTRFPDEDEPSQYDLDVHAVVDLGGGLVAAVNHFGTVRVFSPPDQPLPAPPDRPDLTESAERSFLADLERIVAVDGVLVTSRPRGDRLGGVLVSEPVATAVGPLDAVVALPSFGLVTALAGGPGWAVLGGEGRVTMIDLTAGRRPRVRWDATVRFLPAVIVVSGGTVWAAGSALGGTDLDDYDWAQLRGGGLAQLEVAHGDVLTEASFGGDLAWGSGGVPVVVADGEPFGVGRHGEIHGLAPGRRTTEALTDPLGPDFRGIAHAAVVGDVVLFGFNRGGYRLHTVGLDELRRVGPARRGRRA